MAISGKLSLPEIETSEVTDDQLAAAFRIHQSVTTQNSMPVLIPGNLLAMALAGYSNWQAILNSGAVYAFAFTAFLIIPMIRSYIKLWGVPKPQSVSKRRIRTIEVHSFFLAIGLGTGIILAMSQFNSIQAMTCLTVFCFVAYGAIATISCMPKAVIPYVCIVVLSCGVPMVIHNLADSLLITSLMVISLMATSLTTMTSWRTQKAGVRTELERAAMAQQAISTAKLEAERQKEEAERMRMMIEGMPFPFIVAYKDKVLEASNQAFRQFKLPPKSVNRVSIGSFYVNLADRDDLLERVEKNGRIDEYEVQLKDCEGNQFWVVLSNSPFHYQGKECQIYSIYVIDERKKLEAELKLARQEADIANQSKSDFLSNMSHEIRTPMNAIIGLTGLALNTELTVKQQDYLNKVHNSGTRLLGILNDILDFSKIEAGKMDIEIIPFKLEDVFENLLTVGSVGARSKGLELLYSKSADIPAHLMGDPLRLGQVLINLVGNAVKFTEVGEVVVTVKKLPGSEAENNLVTLQFSVRDTGEGMTQEQQTRLFKAFSQTDVSTSRTHGGTGLGLAISEKLIQSMGGEINVESIAGKGSVFSFTITLECAEQQEAPLPELSAKLINKQVPVIDDNETARHILGDLLKLTGLEPVLLTSGEEALEFLNDTNETFDLIMVDWLMPGIDGFETARRIKQEISSSPKMIMVSAFVNEENIPGDAGEIIAGYLTKPSTLVNLIKVINRAFDEESDSIHRRNRDVFSLGESEIQGARILLVEDNELNQQVAVELLESARFFVDVADDGKQALKLLNNNQYDCVLMDVQMPVMDGYEATRLARIDDRFNNLPIIAMTANVMVSDRNDAASVGMNDHVSKPIVPAELMAVLKKWITPAARDLPEPVTTVNSDQFELVVPKLDGIDTRRGLLHVGSNVASYLKLLNKFTQNQSEAASEIRAAHDNGDMESAVRLAHTIKGLSSTIGATNLASLATEIEAGLPNDDNEHLSEQINRFSVELDAVVNTIEAGLGNKEIARVPDAQPQTPLDPKKLANGIATLREQLEDGDSDAAATITDIQAMFDGHPLYETFVRMGRYLDDYEFDEAADALESAIKEHAILSEGADA